MMMKRFVSLLMALLLSLIATGVCLLLAYPLSMFLVETQKTTHSFLAMLLIVPMWMNFLLRTYAWQSILEKTGIINTALTALGLRPLRMINTPGAIVLGMVYNFLPFMILPIYTTIMRLDPAYIEAANDLGADNREAFLKVTLPLSMPGVMSGISMVFLPAMTNYVVLDMLYNSTYIMGSLIGSYFSAYNWHGGSMIALILLGIICLFTLLGSDDEESTNARGGALL